MAWGARNLIFPHGPELDALRLRLGEEELVPLVLGSPSSEVAAVRAFDRPRRVGAVPQLERRVARRHLPPERLEHRRRPVAPLLHALDQQPRQQAARGPLHLRRRSMHRFQKGKEAPPAEAAPGPLDDVRRPDLSHLHEEGLAPAPAPVGPLQHDRRALLAQPPHDGPREVVPEAGLDRLRGELEALEPLLVPF